ncbi:GH32 C-terminal domain-containing protein [Neokomagataea anthophila]|uniref:DUF2313 domain-containing protein n=1 Tax=Neokomagataea anthophila TaxID=2826925 RepID=A0ABS5E6F3_9PROT|nr:GH32 C-terminal domain-containing protein [Neokomagataea anthophila]MBR0559489.1 DUF2313 domain-containing protein [Neokomagataea anthophila]
MTRTAEQIRDEYLSLMPKSEAWPVPESNIGSYLMAVAMPRAQLEADIGALRNEISPLNSQLLLNDYADLLGPDPYGRDEGVLATAQLQQLLYGRWTARGGQSVSYYQQLGQNFGVNLAIIEQEQTVCGEAVAGDVVTDGQDVYTWVVQLPAQNIGLQRAIYSNRQPHTSISFEINGRDIAWPRQHMMVPGGRINDAQRPLWLGGQWHFWCLWNKDYPNGNGTEWRHFVSPDLVFWTDLGVSIPKYTTEYGDPWTGSTVVDTQNTAGLGAGAVIALCTMPCNPLGGQGTARWVSHDGGESFTFDQIVQTNPNANKGMSDPVFRDPSVFWHAPTGRWNMVLAEIGKVGIYASTDLKSWVYQSGFIQGALGTLECPQLIKLHLYNMDGTTTQDKWVMFCGCNGYEAGFTTGTHYWVGEFDGTTFTPDAAGGQWLDNGPDFYACAITNDTSSNDPQVQAIAIAWMNNWAYADALAQPGFNGQQTLPRVLRLEIGSGGYPIVRNAPVHNQGTVYLRETSYPSAVINDATPFDFRTHRVDFFRLDFDLEPVNGAWPAGGVYLSVRDIGENFTQLALIPSGSYGFLNRGSSGSVPTTDQAWSAERNFPLAMPNGRVSVTAIVDAHSVEFFVNDGAVAVTALDAAPMAARDLLLSCGGGAVMVTNAVLKAMS